MTKRPTIVNQLSNGWTEQIFIGKAFRPDGSASQIRKWKDENGKVGLDALATPELGESGAVSAGAASTMDRGSSWDSPEEKANRPDVGRIRAALRRGLARQLVPRALSSLAISVPRKTPTDPPGP
jgi:hypothetical protein